MTQYRFVKSQRFTVVHEVCARAHAPQRRSANTCSRNWSTVLHDEISSADIMQQEVAERVNGFAGQCLRYLERAAIDRLAPVCSRDRRHMTDAATILLVHRFKQCSAGSDVSRKLILDITILRRRLRGSHEFGKHLHVLFVVFTTQD